MKGNISKEMQEALRTEEGRKQIMGIVHGDGRGSVRVGDKTVTIYRAGSQKPATKPAQ